MLSHVRVRKTANSRIATLALILIVPAFGSFAAFEVGSYDECNGTAINGTLWQVTVGGDGTAAEETGGAIHVGFHEGGGDGTGRIDQKVVSGTGLGMAVMLKCYWERREEDENVNTFAFTNGVVWIEGNLITNAITAVGYTFSVNNGLGIDTGGQVEVTTPWLEIGIKQAGPNIELTVNGVVRARCDNQTIASGTWFMLQGRNTTSTTDRQIDWWLDWLRLNGPDDSNPPHNCSVVINNGANIAYTKSATLTLNAVDDVSGMTNGMVRLRNEGGAWSADIPYAASVPWTLSSGNGTKTVSALFSDRAGNWTPSSVSDTIDLNDRDLPQGYSMGRLDYVVPAGMNFQGRLTDLGGDPLSGSYSVTFRIYNQAAGGSPLWEETQTLNADVNGFFSAVLGSLAPIALNFDQDYWIGLTVAGEAEMQPRVKLATVPYSFTSKFLRDVGSLIRREGNFLTLSNDDKIVLKPPLSGEVTVICDDGIRIQREDPACNVQLHIKNDQAWMSTKGSGTEFVFEAPAVIPKDDNYTDLGRGGQRWRGIYAADTTIHGVAAERLAPHPDFRLGDAEKQSILQTMRAAGHTDDRTVAAKGTDAVIRDYRGPLSKLQPGMVVCITAEGYVPCSRENDTSLAGIISTQPGVRCDDGQTLGDFICLMGKAPCYVTGPIRAGDLLTTSEKPGHAKRALVPTLGAVVGKALENSNAESAKIMVWVGGM
jgi:hypothetical protein